MTFLLLYQQKMFQIYKNSGVFLTEQFITVSFKFQINYQISKNLTRNLRHPDHQFTSISHLKGIF